MSTGHTESMSERDRLLMSLAAIEDNLRQAQSNALMWQQRLDEVHEQIAVLDSLAEARS